MSPDAANALLVFIGLLRKFGFEGIFACACMSVDVNKRFFLKFQRIDNQGD